MRIAFAISLEDFRSWQSAFTLRPGRSAWLKAILVPFAMIAFGGVFCLMQGSALSIVGGLLIALGAGFAALAYVLERQSMKNKRVRYELWITDRYENLHCRDERVVDVDENGFRFSCKCGEVIRPWTELLRFSENESLFVIGTKTETHVIPKTAFSSEGTMTEFRAMFRERFEQGRVMIAQVIDFKYERSDYRHAVLLHIIAGGGWRLLAKALLGMVMLIFVIVAVWDYARAHGGAIGFIGGGLGALIYRLLRRGKPKYLGTQRVFLDANGIQLEDHGTTARIPWKQLAGFLEDRNVLLLYYHSGVYRLIPKRALADRESEVRALIREHLPRFNYRSLRAIPLPE
jgi:hypothetical protein